MVTILGRLVERLDGNINRLRRAKQRLKKKNLEDKLLDQQLQRLVSLRNRLRSRDNSTGSQAIDSVHSPTPEDSRS